MVSRTIFCLAGSLLLSSCWVGSLLGQTAVVSSLEATVYEAEAVLICTIDKCQMMPQNENGTRLGVLTLNPLRMLKGKLDRGTNCVVTIFDKHHANRVNSWVDDEKEFVLAVKHYSDGLRVTNQSALFHGSSRDSKSKLFSYWYDFKIKRAASMADAIKDVEEFLENEATDPATGTSSLYRPGHLLVHVPVNSKLNWFSQRALRQELTKEEVSQTSGQTRGPLQLESITSFDVKERTHEVEWLATSAVSNLKKSEENIELLKSLLAKTPIEFARTEYRDDENEITVYRRFQIRAQIRAKLAQMGVDVGPQPLDDVVWTRRKDPEEIALLKKLGDPEVFFNLDPFHPPEEFTRVKKMFLRGKRWVNAPDLSGLRDLEMLKFEHTKLSDVSELSKLKRLRFLDVGYSPLASISPLSQLTTLEQLDLRGTKVVDLAPLSGLSKLEILNIELTKVRDLMPLKGLKQLRMLTGGPEKLDMTPLEGLTELEHWFGG